MARFWWTLCFLCWGLVSGQSSLGFSSAVRRLPPGESVVRVRPPSGDSLWTHTWDAENRLIRMTTQLPNSALPAKRIEFQYDWQGRRIAKRVYDSAVGGNEVTSLFLYDGWNLVGVLDGSGNLRQTFVWGLDVSGTGQGAGGVGGLLWLTDGVGTAQERTAFRGYDASGNVIVLVQATDPLLGARYEYGPFGEVIRMTGPLAAANPFRFSTKFTDDETGLLYYGYRYYSPSLGRWLSRDPIGERGGINLYAFCGNDPVNRIDSDGLAPQNWTVGEHLKRDRPDPTSPSGWRGGNGRFIPAPKSPGSVLRTPPPASPAGLENPWSDPPGTPIGAVAGGMALAADVLAARLEQMVIDHHIDEGLKTCRAQAKERGGCCMGCCVVNLYLVTGKNDSFRNVYSGGSQFFSKACLGVQADMAVLDSQPGLDPYYGRWEHERWWGYRLFSPNASDASLMRPIDNQLHVRRYLDISSCSVK